MPASGKDYTAEGEEDRKNARCAHEATSPEPNQFKFQFEFWVNYFLPFLGSPKWRSLFEEIGFSIFLLFWSSGSSVFSDFNLINWIHHLLLYAVCVRRLRAEQLIDTNRLYYNNNRLNKYYLSSCYLWRNLSFARICLNSILNACMQMSSAHP